MMDNPVTPSYSQSDLDVIESALLPASAFYDTNVYLGELMLVSLSINHSAQSYVENIFANLIKDGHATFRHGPLKQIGRIIEKVYLRCLRFCFVRQHNCVVLSGRNRLCQ